MSTFGWILLSSVPSTGTFIAGDDGALDGDMFIDGLGLVPGMGGAWGCGRIPVGEPKKDGGAGGGGLGAWGNGSGPEFKRLPAKFGGAIAANAPKPWPFEPKEFPGALNPEFGGAGGLALIGVKPPNPVFKGFCCGKGNDGAFWLVLIGEPSAWLYCGVNAVFPAFGVRISIVLARLPNVPKPVDGIVLEGFELIGDPVFDNDGACGCEMCDGCGDNKTFEPDGLTGNESASPW